MRLKSCLAISIPSYVDVFDIFAFLHRQQRSGKKVKLKALSPLSVLESLSCCSFTSYSNFAGNYPSFAVGEKGGGRARMGVRNVDGVSEC